jgi:hypothetical protein
MNLADNHIQQIISDNGGNFKSSEFLEDRELLHPIVVQELVAFRNWCKYPIQITSAFRNNGSHQTGKAIDFLLWDEWKRSQPDPMHLWRMVTTWPFLGCGLYFDWNNGIGIHIDVIRQGRQRPLRWLRKEGEYYYQSIQDGLFYNGNKRVSLQNEVK